MAENINYLYQYLEKENIIINKFEFKFQIESHPDYPGILAITDTLSFFDINNGVLKVEASEIDLLPDNFLTLLACKNNTSQFYLIEKKGDIYYISEKKNKEIISKSELEFRWKGMVLLVEKSEEQTVIDGKNKNWFWLLPALCTISFIIVVLQFPISILTKSFFFFPILGILFSIAVMKDLFQTEIVVLNRFCNMTSSSNCSTVVNSKKWKIFDFLSFSDLSIILFCSQFFALLLFLFMNDSISYFSIQKTILMGSISVLLISIYYQKFVAKKWCPLCLVIGSIILLELIYIEQVLQITIELSLQALIVFQFIFLSTCLFWFAIKKLLIQQNILKEFQIKSNRFIRSYEIFKNNLLASESIEHMPILSEETIILGNPEAPLRILIVTSPFCGFCAEAHAKIEEIVNKYDNVCFNIHFNYNEANDDLKSQKIHQLLVSIYLNHGQQSFINVINDWYKDMEINKLDSWESSVNDNPNINLILARQFQWNQLNHIKFTPSIIINGYFLPKQYNISDLIYFINDLSEDDDLNKN